MWGHFRQRMLDSNRWSTSAMGFNARDPEIPSTWQIPSGIIPATWPALHPSCYWKSFSSINTNQHYKLLWKQFLLAMRNAFNGWPIITINGADLWRDHPMLRKLQLTWLPMGMARGLQEIGLKDHSLRIWHDGWKCYSMTLEGIRKGYSPSVGKRSNNWTMPWVFFTMHLFSWRDLSVSMFAAAACTLSKPTPH